MAEKFLKEIIAGIVGKQYEELANLLTKKDHTNEFIISKKLGITINQTRNLLYRISDYGLVNSIRKKDKKKGWYTYYWKLDKIKALEFLRDSLLKRINQIQNQINNRENRQYYTCERCGIEVNDETALHYEFTCNECGDVFTLKDNSKILKELKKNLAKFNSKLEELDEVIKKEKEKEEKAAARRKSAKKTTKKKTTKKKSTTKKESSKKTTRKTAKKKTTKKKSSGNSADSRSKKSSKKTTKKKTTKKKSTTKKETSKKKSAKKSTGTTKKKTSKKKTTKKKGSANSAGSRSKKTSKKTNKK